ncbi:MAG TPA: HAD family hydrolase [Ktedonobacteraceae bacterium]|nr:HAD family hydrolase [Ktedonobacteraceae bacterium]
MIQALIFDFDGLIVDTEWPEFQSWQEICLHYNVELALETWLPCVGTGATTQVFDPHEYLEAQIGKILDREEIYAQRWPRHKELIRAQPILPGVETLLIEAKRRGMGLAVASSSGREWVIGHLDRLGLQEHFDAFACGDEVRHTKPYPDLYQAALEKLGVQPGQAVAFEDSLNGMLAARGAGIFCVVVPNRLTQHLPFGQVDLRLSSLAEISLDELIERCKCAHERSV